MSAPAQRQDSAGSAPPSVRERINEPIVGSVVGFEGGQVRVDFPGSAGSPKLARALSLLDDAALERAARERAEAVLLFEEGDPARPLLVGLLRSPTPLVDALLAAPLETTRERVAHVDGRRVVIEGKEEIVLQCGKSSLTLRRDGTVVLRGVNVVSQAEEVHKIRGGKVQVN